MTTDSAVREVTYDGDSPFPDDGTRQMTTGGRIQIAVTVAIVAGPFAGLAAAVWLAWGHGVGLTDLLLAFAFYMVTGLGVTVGFHRMLTHGSFSARPALRVALAIAGSMSFEGDVIGWVATHRRHHAFADRPGDPHSPYRYGTSVTGQLRGLAHAHMGWLMHEDPTPRDRYAPDMLADRGMRRVSAAFPALCIASLALPFAIGWALGGTLRAGLLALVWAGLVRITLAPARDLERELALPRVRRAVLSAPAGTTAPPTCGPWRCSRSARAGTTCTTPTRPAPATARTRTRSTSPRASSGSSSGLAG